MKLTFIHLEMIIWVPSLYKGHTAILVIMDMNKASILTLGWIQKEIGIHFMLFAKIVLFHKMYSLNTDFHLRFSSNSYMRPTSAQSDYSFPELYLNNKVNENSLNVISLNVMTIVKRLECEDSIWMIWKWNICLHLSFHCFLLIRVRWTHLATSKGVP